MFEIELFICIKSRNKKNTYDFLVQVWNFLLPLSLKVFRHKERDTIFLCWLYHLTQTTCGTRCKASASSESQPSSSEAETQLTFLKSQPTLLVRDVIHTSWSHFLSGVLFWHLWMTHPPCAHVNTCAHVAPNPCAKRNVLSLTKSKGKIYKMKSLGHFITIKPHQTKIITHV